MTFGELFAGIGGFSLGLERAGMTCKWQVEIDPYATAVLKKHWPEVQKHEDVRTFPPQGDYSVDLICGGFPCQDISVAGKGAGLAGARSGLWHEFARIIGTVRPRWVVIENVPALTARGLGTVLGDLAEIGFDAEWHCIPASAVGAPHRRERIWIVAFRDANCERSDLQCVSDSKDGREISQASRRKPSRVSGTPHVANTVSEPDAMRRNGSPCSQGVDGRDCNAGGSQCDRRARCAGQAGQGSCYVENSERIVDRTEEHGEEVDRTHAKRSAGGVGGSSWWLTEPDVGQVAHGIPSRVDRLRCLGNAVVPQVVEVIGRAILDRERRLIA